jgi:hypothetical protein
LLIGEHVAWFLRKGAGCRPPGVKVHRICTFIAGV